MCPSNGRLSSSDKRIFDQSWPVFPSGSKPGQPHTASQMFFLFRSRQLLFNIKFIWCLLSACLCTYCCVYACGLRCLGWRGRSLMPAAQWLMEINVWFAGYFIKDLMLKHAPLPPTLPPSPALLTVKKLPYWVHLFISPSFKSCVCKVEIFASDHACVRVCECVRG